MNFGRLAIRIAILFAAIGITPAEAFILLRGAIYEKGERPVAESPIWPTRKVSFVVNTNLSAMGGSLALPLTGAELLEAAEAAVNAWAAACRADLRVEILGSTNTTYSSSDAVNVIQWDNRTTGEGNYYGTALSTLAAATTVLRGTDFADCDIVLNGNSSTTMKFSPAIGEADLRSVLTHEIGHCLGLDHPIEPPDYTSVDPFITESTMVQTASTGLDPSDSGRRDINQDDRDGIECLYERGKPFRTGIHCGSYTGTSGQGALTGAVVGGPTVVDTVCGGDAQGRNAHPALDSGDGCIPAALASSSDGSAPRNPLGRLGGSFGFFTAIAALLAFRIFRRRSLRRANLVSLVTFILVATEVPSARAFDLELTYGVRDISPSTWNSFAGMDPQATAWDREPNAVKLGSLSEIRATAFSEFTDWGKWGGSISFTLPKTLETNAKAQNAAEQAKRTSISGFRVGPDFRWYPNGAGHAARWFVGGRFGIGFFSGTQTFTNATESQVTYRAWATELALSTGAEIPIGPLALVLEGGYSRHRSSYFASTGSEGAAYSDFPSGTRLATNTGPGSEDVKFNGSGLFATIGLQMTFGSNGPSATTVEKFDDYEKPATRQDAPPPNEAPKNSADEASGANPTTNPAPAPSPVPAPTQTPNPNVDAPVSAPSGTPLADPLEEERKFQESLRPVPAPGMAPDGVPSVPSESAPTAPRNDREPDPIPSIDPAIFPAGEPAPIREPDPVPFDRGRR